MRHPQILVYERDGRLARLLSESAEANRWVLREPRQIENCLALLREGGPSVLVLRVGSKLETELGLLEQAHRLRPDAAIFAVGDVENDPLAGLLWDLGAHYVLFPPQPREQLPEIVAHWLNSAAQAPQTEDNDATPRPAGAG